MAPADNRLKMAEVAIPRELAIKIIGMAGIDVMRCLEIKPGKLMVRPDLLAKHPQAQMFAGTQKRFCSQPCITWSYHSTPAGCCECWSDEGWGKGRFCRHVFRGSCQQNCFFISFQTHGLINDGDELFWE